MIRKPTEAYPLSWPEGFDRTLASKRERARFGQKGERWGRNSLTVHQALTRLTDEIRAFTRSGRSWRIHPDHVVVSSNVRTRQDGMPYSSARAPDDPGVAVYLELDGEPHVFPCDRWDRLADNIAAVAAHLGAMRGIERWGVGDLRRAFAGFAALPPGTGESYGHVKQWWETLGVNESATRPQVELAYRRLRSKHHPDRGGDAKTFDEITRAFEVARRGWK